MIKVCILGTGLTSLALAKALINIGIYVDIFFNLKKIKKQNKSRTIGMSQSNIKFFNQNILNIEKLLWDIKHIEIYSEILNNEKILDFRNNNQRLFSIIKNYELYKCLLSNLKKSSFLKFKKKLFNYDSVKNNYKLVINCDTNNNISKKFFYRRFNKDYESYAYTAIMSHKKLLNNNTAFQTFTNRGPIAFLPINNKQTSIVFSAKGKNNIEVIDLIKKHNTKYESIKIKDISRFELKSSHLRSYHHKNILAFGDLLHKIHPLAGQGFNMSIRDIKELTKIIKFKIDHGLDLDNSVCLDFEKHNKHKNYLFTNGIDFIYEFFNLEGVTQNNIFSKSVRLLGNNKIVNKFVTKFADSGIKI